METKTLLAAFLIAPKATGWQSVQSTHGDTPIIRMLVSQRDEQPAAFIKAHVQLSRGRTRVLFNILETGVDQALAFITRTGYQQAGVAEQ